MSIGATLGWFKPFDWVVRINPDVLIRNSSFLMDCVNDPAVDAVIIWCSPLRIHTDFFAFRPKALGPDAFVNMTNEHATIPRINHEATVTTSFMEIIKSSRYRMVPDLKPSQGHCRVRGEKAPVYHMHDSK